MSGWMFPRNTLKKKDETRNEAQTRDMSQTASQAENSMSSDLKFEEKENNRRQELHTHCGSSSGCDRK
jgi:hypothetical protein